FGLAREALIGFGYLRHLRRQDARSLLDGMRERRDEPSGFSHEFYLRDGGGVERELLATGRPFRDADGGVGYIVSTTEIGHLRDAERALAVERGRLEALLEALPHVVVLSSPETGVEYVSPQSHAILGYAPESLLGFGMYDLLFHPDDRESLRERRRGWLETPQAFEHEFRAIHADGREIPMSMRGFPLPAREGVTHSHVITFTDLTELHHAETQAEDERREAAARTQTMLDAMPLWVGLVAPDGRLLAVNRTPVEAAGKTVEDVLGNVVWEEWTEGDPETTRILRDVIERAARGERVTQEMTYRWEDGTFETEYHAVPIRDADGEVTTIATSALDVTERNAARRRAESEGELMRQILGNSPILKALCDRGGRVLFANDALLQTVGVTLEEIRNGFLWENDWTRESGLTEIIQDACQRAMQGETAFTEFTFARADGEATELELRVAPIYASGTDLQYVFATAQDVTSRNRARRDVESERNLLQEVMENAPVLMALLDHEGRVLFVNAPALRTLGLALDEVRGRT
ncbi:PAS domain S-box protein, partial [bacterium]